MIDKGQHAACVDAWLKGAAKGRSRDALVQLFQAALAALWNRAKVTLGEITLTAIADRVVHNAAARFPPLSSLEVDPTNGIACGDLGGPGSSLRGAELLGAIRFVLVEFLTVLGTLTAEILTADLHGVLTNVQAPAAKGQDKKS